MGGKPICGKCRSPPTRWQFRSFPRGEGGPKGRMRNAGRKPIDGTCRCLFQTVSPEEAYRFPKLIGYRPHSSSVSPSGCHLPPGGRDRLRRGETWAERLIAVNVAGFFRGYSFCVFTDSLYKDDGSGPCRGPYFLVAEQESKQRSQPGGGAELLAPAPKSRPPPGPPPGARY